MVDNITPEQQRLMALTERIASGVSIIGILFIIFTYSFSSSFSKPINRLVFYASWGNLGLCIVALISIDGPNAGRKKASDCLLLQNQAANGCMHLESSALCQFQGFMAQLYSYPRC